MQAKHVQVLIRRDMAEILSTNVFEHEVEILRDIHGAGNIEVLDEVFPSIEIDENEEFDRLNMVYGKNDSGQSYVERVIGYTPRQLASYAPGDDEPAPVKRGRKPKVEE